MRVVHQISKSEFSKSGFTLLELSIVLVIIGLIIGGITVGQGLIKSAELNSIASEVQKYTVAVNSFRLKYNALPGDMANATLYWGKDNTNCTTHTGTTATPGTCNGDRDGQWDSGERFRVWQHLSLAEIIPGSYTGVAGTPSYIIGTNMPASSYSPAGYFPAYNTSFQGTTKAGNRLGLGSHHASAGGNSNWNGFIEPTEAHALDTKMDDGLADEGNLITVNGSSFAPQFTSGDCITGVSGTFSYVLSSTLKSCHPSFFID